MDYCHLTAYFAVKETHVNNGGLTPAGVDGDLNAAVRLANIADGDTIPGLVGSVLQRRYDPPLGLGNNTGGDVPLLNVFLPSVTFLSTGFISVCR